MRSGLLLTYKKNNIENKVQGQTLRSELIWVLFLSPSIYKFDDVFIYSGLSAE